MVSTELVTVFDLGEPGQRDLTDVGRATSTVGWASGRLFLISSTSRMEAGAILPCAS
jgi:hypothetical protein